MSKTKLIRCNNCERYFENEHELSKIVEVTATHPELGDHVVSHFLYDGTDFPTEDSENEGEDFSYEIFRGCPGCLEDAYLMDVELDDKTILGFWEDFEDVPLNPETEVLEEDFLCFPAETQRDYVWSWFDKVYSKGIRELVN